MGLARSPLLTRNQLPAEILPSAGSFEICADHSDIDIVIDFWSDDFVVPDWVRTPMNLVQFYMRRLTRSYDQSGNPWIPPLGNNPRVYLRPAKTLLDTLGRDKAVRLTAESIAIARHPPSLQWIKKRMDELIANGDISCKEFPSTKQLTLMR